MKARDITDVIKDETQLLDLFLEGFDGDLQLTQNQIYDLLLEEINGFKTRNGIILRDEKTRALINRIGNKVLNRLAKSPYAKCYNKLIASLDDIIEVRKQVSAFANPDQKDLIFKSSLGKIKQSYTDIIALNLGQEDSLGSIIVNPIKRKLYQYAAIGGRIDDLASELKADLVSETLGGGLVGRSGQVAHDLVFQFNGAIDYEISKITGAKDVNYVGNLIETSRPQCIRWVTEFGGFIPADKLESELKWAKNNGGGYSKFIPPPTIETFATNRGGHRCRHKVIYTAKKVGERIKEIKDQYGAEQEALILKAREAQEKKNLQNIKKY